MRSPSLGSLELAALLAVSRLGDEAYGLAADCMRTALSRRTGPVFMDVPIDVFFGAADVPEATEHLTPDRGPSPDPDAIRDVVRLLQLPTIDGASKSCNSVTTWVRRCCR